MDKTPSRKVNFFCKICKTKFAYKKNLLKHINSPSRKCQALKVEAAAKKRLTDVQEKNQQVVEALVRAPAGAKRRQRIVANVEARDKIRNFERTVLCAMIPERTLRKTCLLSAEGDVLIFRRIFIDDIEPKNRCIRVLDDSREKYSYYDGMNWITSTLDWIVREFCKAMYEKYLFIVDEKHAKLDDIDGCYFAPERAEMRNILYNEMTDQYAVQTTHIMGLIAGDDGICHRIKQGIRGYLCDPFLMNNMKKTNLPPIKYNEDAVSRLVNRPPKSKKEKELDDLVLPNFFRSMGLHLAHNVLL